MDGIRIAITPWQHEQLRPFFNKTRQHAKEGNPIGLFAQVWEGDVSGEAEGWLDIRLIDGDICKKIQVAVGQEPGKIPDLGKTVTVLVPENDDNKSL